MKRRMGVKEVAVGEPAVRHRGGEIEVDILVARREFQRVGLQEYEGQRYRGQDDDWTGEIQVSLTATRQLIELLVPKFETRGDRGIVLVSSVFGDRVGDGQPLSYHLCKAGMNQMTRFYAANLGQKGIRVNAITPFTFLKEESKDFYLNNKELSDLYQEIIPLGRMGTTEDSANAIAFLCSPAAGFITGQNLYIDGGMSLVWPETIARRLRSI